MLRFALLVLLLANAGYLAWTQGWMASLGWAPEVQAEPQRLARQVRPEVLILPGKEAPAATNAKQTASPAAPRTTASNPTSASSEDTSLDTHTAPAQTATASTPVPAPTPPPAPLPEPTLCLQTDHMDQAQHEQVRQALRQADLPANSWEWVSTNLSGRWMVYLGKFPNETAMEKRRAELRARKIGYDRAGGALEPGLSLGRFSTEEAATRELTNMLGQGIRGARVVQERPPQTLYTLRFASLPTSQRSNLQTLRTALADKALRTCPPSQ